MIGRLESKRQVFWFSFGRVGSMVPFPVTSRLPSAEGKMVGRAGPRTAMPEETADAVVEKAVEGVAEAPPRRRAWVLYSHIC